MVEEMHKKNDAGQWLALPESEKKAMERFVEDATEYELSLRLVGDTAEFIVDNIKPDAVSVEGAKASLRAIADQFTEKKKTITDTIDKINQKIAVLEDMISKLDAERFAHRIEAIQTVISKFGPHLKRFQDLTVQIEERKKIRLEEAKAIIMKGHRKYYFENLH